MNDAAISEGLMDGLVHLDEHECLRLLGDHHFGRLGFISDDQPFVFPVNYTMLDRDVMFRSQAGLKLTSAVDCKVCFEIDSADAFAHSGWSVVLLGTLCREIDPVVLLDHEHLPLGSWVPGPKPYWMRIRMNAVSGRRISRGG